MPLPPGPGQYLGPKTPTLICPDLFQPGPYRFPADDRASLMASRLRQKSMCSFKPRLSVIIVREHTGQCCSVLSSLLVEVGRKEFSPSNWYRSDVSSTPSLKQGSSSSTFSSPDPPLVLRRLFGSVGFAPVGSKNYSRAKSVSHLFPERWVDE
jgi:hypothetical protein